MLGPQQISQLRARLLARRQDLEHELFANKHFGNEQASVLDDLGELSSYDNYPADYGSETFEQGKDLALNAHAERELQDIDQALKAMAEGRYGICELCGRPIPFERLAAIPATRRCLEHADQFVSEKRPVEETILTPPFSQFEVDEASATYFDSEDAWQEVARYNELTGTNYEDVEPEEARGYVEDIEGFLVTDIYGKEVSYVDNNLRAKYQQNLDDAGVISILGNPGLEDITWWEGYVDPEKERRLQDES